MRSGSGNADACYQSMPVQILGVLRLACPGMIHMKEKGDTGRYRLRFMLKFLRTALTL